MITLNDINKKRQVTNYSTFTDGKVAGVAYTKPVAYIKAFLNNELTEKGKIDYQYAKHHFLSVGITQATVNTQTNLFRATLAKNGTVTETVPQIKYALKSLNDLAQFTLIAILNEKNEPIQVLNEKAYSNEKINKIAIPTHNNILVISDI